MSIVLAAIDDSTAARCVLDAASGLARVMGVGVEALHVHENGSGTTASGAAVAAGIRLREVKGDPTSCIVEASASLDVVAVAVGCRGLLSGPEPAGHVALDVIQAVDKPVVAVPQAVTQVQPVERVLVPLDGSGATTRALRVMLGPVKEHDGPELIALHVFEPGSLPAFGDSPTYETEAWAQEFLDRFSPVEAEGLRLEMRVGAPADVVREVAGEVHADLVAVGWRRDLSPGRGIVVRALLRASPVPVLLLPMAEVPAGV